MDQYAVIGNPIEHSKSPQVHAEFAKQTHQSLTYTKILSPIDAFEATVTEFKKKGGKGLNVTLPFKEQAFHFANELSPRASHAKAVNTLVFRSDGSIYGDSTDAVGLIRDLTRNHHFSLQNKNILLIGAGGATRSVVAPLLELNPKHITIANRTEEKAKALVKEFNTLGKLSATNLENFKDAPYDLIINTTSAGLTGSALNLPDHLINKNTWCYDMVYGNTITPFLAWAKKLDAAQCLDGLGMLVEQAAESFFIWRGVHPETKPVIQMLKR